MKVEQIDKLYDELSEEKKTDYLKLFNKKKKFLIFLFSFFTFIFLFYYIIGLIKNISTSGPIDILLITLFCLLFIGIFVACIIINLKALKWSDEKKIKKQIEILEKKRNAEVKQLNMRIATERAKGIYAPDIQSVVILDAYTEMSDKLHAFFNYQEIIQNRYYKFKVNYSDGSYRIITAKENSTEYNTLMGFVGNNVGNSTTCLFNSDNADLILKYKKLLDEGIISQEEFDKKKTEKLK